MPSNSQDIAMLARKLNDELAAGSLPPAFAKLYSQHTRLRTGQPSLSVWGQYEAADRLDDAMRLIEAAFICQETGSGDWQSAMCRAGELMEWLSHPQLALTDIPVRLLAASAYQIAGYPARASALLADAQGEDNHSEIVRCLLKADFVGLLQRVSALWGVSGLTRLASQSRELPWREPNELGRALHEWIVWETTSALGLLCAFMRWGSQPRLEMALSKLDSVAKFAIHGDDPYAWFLAKLCAFTARTYVSESLRQRLPGLVEGTNADGKDAFERYARLCYLSNRALTWPSQARGIEKLISTGSFALCTPTGSGKTMVAELAIVQSLFASRASEEMSPEVELPQPIAIYLVPSRALAAEVESKLSRVLRRLSGGRVVVTGLYGGTDWGPTDAWLTADDRTVLICTYEKGEALIRFLGPHFIHRVSLVVVDEAHKVQFDGNLGALREAESRPLRLETLGARLLMHLRPENSKIIALSAVASGCEKALANWITNDDSAVPVSAFYRSTRQLVGRLECQPGRRFEILYDVLDGASLKFADIEGDSTPYIPNPFPLYPPAPSCETNNPGPEVQLRPYLFWAALQLAKPDENGERHSVLISVPQHPEYYATALLRLLDSDWANVDDMPDFFSLPTDPGKIEVWSKCLRSCEDYFGPESNEFRLLRKGIILHHGKMPGLTARLLIEVVEARIAQVVIATSTLSEGVNLPFETVLIPTVQRGQSYIDSREFTNLVGRAGRPGHGTEGRTLVLMRPKPPARKPDWRIENARKAYFKLIGALKPKTDACEIEAESPLAALVSSLRAQWNELNPTGSETDFVSWLEFTAPLSFKGVDDPDNTLCITQTLDSLDSVLLTAIVESEQMTPGDIDKSRLENCLIDFWRRSYAHYASRHEDELEAIFVNRGNAITDNIYPDSVQRTRLYHTSLPPRMGTQLLDLYPDIVKHLESGENYAVSSNEDRLQYVQTAVDLLSQLAKFAPSNPPRGAASWQAVLHWWLDRKSASAPTPNAAQMVNWMNYVQQSFGYRISWGLGSIIALATSEAFSNESHPLTLQDWPRTGLPWAAFWLKELLVWGTLDPVAAFLLAKGLCVTRSESEDAAKAYYESLPDDIAANDIYDPSRIRQWADDLTDSERSTEPGKPFRRIEVALLRDFETTNQHEWRVIPVDAGQYLYWVDPADFPLAASEKPEGWQAEHMNNYDFMLDVSTESVSAERYL